MSTEGHDRMVERIALETGFPSEIVQEIYLAAFLELSVDARIDTYLPVFAAKRTVARLRSAVSSAKIKLALTA